MSLAASMRGFPEWLPPGQLVEQAVLARLRETFELHGYSPLDTRSVETLETLLEKGETDKELYLLRRLRAEPEDSDSGLGLHFDLTVPFARYVRENAGKLAFPYRRYQIQKCWRGERPQEGRYREFLQADVDIVGRGELPAQAEAEVALVAADALSRLPIPPVMIQVNNRKIVEGAFLGVGLEGDVTAAFRALDKLRKIGPEAVAGLLVEAGATARQAETCLRLAAITSRDLSFAEEVRRLGVTSQLLEDGVEELSAVLEVGRAHFGEASPLVADLQITRGLDYYTGTVYETVMAGYESLGSVCSGGRYDNLVGGEAEAYPGVGLSVGVTRIVGPLLARGGLSVSRSVPTCVLVAVVDEAHRHESEQIAAGLRSRGIPTEVSPTAAKYGRQIRYADQRGIPYVWFPGAGAGAPDTAAAPATDVRAGAGAATGAGEVRDLRSGEQQPADPASWEPPAEDLHPTVTGGVVSRGDGRPPTA
jgi:histidyl-tRNA synthetase